MGFEQLITASINPLQLTHISLLVLFLDSFLFAVDYCSNSSWMFLCTLVFPWMLVFLCSTSSSCGSPTLLSYFTFTRHLKWACEWWIEHNLQDLLRLLLLQHPTMSQQMQIIYIENKWQPFLNWSALLFSLVNDLQQVQTWSWRSIMKIVGLPIHLQSFRSHLACEDLPLCHRVWV